MIDRWRACSGVGLLVTILPFAVVGWGCRDHDLKCKEHQTKRAIQASLVSEPNQFGLTHIAREKFQGARKPGSDRSFRTTRSGFERIVWASEHGCVGLWISGSADAEVLDLEANTARELELATERKFTPLEGESRTFILSTPGPVRWISLLVWYIKVDLSYIENHCSGLIPGPQNPNLVYWTIEFMRAFRTSSKAPVGREMS